MKVHVELPLTPEQKEANKKRIEGQKKTNVKTLKKTNECSNCNFGGANLQETHLPRPCLNASIIFGKLAEDLLSTLKPFTSVAVQPFRPEETDLPIEMTVQLNEDLIEKLIEKGKGRLQIKTRSDLLSVWREVEQFQMGNEKINQLLSGLEGVRIRYKAYDLRPGHRGQVIAFSKERCLRQQLSINNFLPLPIAVSRTARQLLLRSPVFKNIKPGGAYFQQTGERSVFGDYFTSLLLQELQKRVVEIKKEDSQPITGDKVTPKPSKKFQIRVTVWDHVNFVVITSNILNKFGEEIARQNIRINTSSIPSHFLPLTPKGGKVATGIYTATGHAQIGKHLSKATAFRAAVALARARVVGQALNLYVPGLDLAHDTGDAVEALNILSQGIPYEEQWINKSVGPKGRVTVSVQAKVKQMGGAGAPKIEVALESQIVKSGAPIILRLKTDRKVYLGVFGWQADATVIRLYPNKKGHRLEISPGREFSLPPEYNQVWFSKPLPGSTADHESIVVVASAVQFDPTRFAPVAGGTIDESMERAVEAGAFLNALARENLSAMSIVFLPYQVLR